ncbi:hypothetical protein K4P18_05345 [Staphylococcus epidermidis]|uniref:hypothetical protein n=1 Tax=Staphylococcus epidermidis TaxID=1282 RepID=UPI00187A7A22|nr:hypothetical protein [Staphylococcus epidermidis]MBE7304049.1 hypothetical protein [Staphylococcus epidermidis]MCG1162620.1 hypothetical protein [Staphylococcus epidermidis]MCG1439448.1 hypothetical protein [Staphylococcus epidermidis]MCG1753213.1 hypothetical protein [Staphylococcus epidermidis]MCG1838020.1 hypothetical protein [Staphylococcus epidermidis]
MTDKIKILPAIEDRYQDNKMFIPITQAKYKQFMLKTDIFIRNLNNLLKTNDTLYCIVYDGICMNINSDLMNFKRMNKSQIEILLENTKLEIVEYYVQLEREISKEEEEYIENIFLNFMLAINNYKQILNSNNGSEGKMRGILMEALSVSIFGDTDMFEQNLFIWDFKAFENNAIIKTESRETADIYFEKKKLAHVCEIKCRPSGIEETQVDYIIHLTKKLHDIDKLQYNAIILHGGTAEEFNFENINFSEKLKDFQIYTKENIKELLKII